MPMLDIQLSPQNDSRRDLVLSLPYQIDDRTMPSDVADSIRGLWADPGVKEAVRRAFGVKGAVAERFGILNHLLLWALDFRCSFVSCLTLRVGG